MFFNFRQADFEFTHSIQLLPERFVIATFTGRCPGGGPKSKPEVKYCWFPRTFADCQKPKLVESYSGLLR